MLAHNSASLQTAFQHELHFYVLGLQNMPGGNLRALSKVQLRGEIFRIKKNHLAKKRETDSSVSNTFLSGKKKVLYNFTLNTKIIQNTGISRKAHRNLSQEKDRQ